MDRNGLDAGSEGRFAAFVESMSSILGHADRIAPFRSYCTGLILPGERKSVEPIAARVEPGRVQRRINRSIISSRRPSGLTKRC